MAQTPRRLPKAVSESWIWLLPLLAACGEAPDSTSLPGDPNETVREQMPAAGSTAPATAAAGGEGNPAMQSEGIDPETVRVANAPAQTAPAQPAATQPAATQPPMPAETMPAEPGSKEPGEVTMPPGQPVPPIGQPGFPAGSAPRLVPMQFVGPITGLPVLFNVYLPPGY